MSIGANPGDTATLAFAFGGDAAAMRLFDIKITQARITTTLTKHNAIMWSKKQRHFDPSD